MKRKTEVVSDIHPHSPRKIRPVFYTSAAVNQALCLLTASGTTAATATLATAQSRIIRTISRKVHKSCPVKPLDSSVTTCKSSNLYSNNVLARGYGRRTAVGWTTASLHAATLQTSTGTVNLTQDVAKESLQARKVAEDQEDEVCEMPEGGYAVRALHSLESGGGVGNSALDKADLAKLRQVKAADDESPPLAEAAKLDAERRERLAGSLRTVAGLGDFLEGFLQDK